MKYYTFYSETNDFKDLLTDVSVKHAIKTKISWDKWIIIGFSEQKTDNLFGYIVLKYGEMIKNPIEKDYTPVINVDYIPKRN